MITEQSLIVIPFSEEKLKSIVSEAIKFELSKVEKQKSEKELMNAKELCEYLGIHISTLNNWKAHGKIPFKRLGKRIFFEKAEVKRALVESNYNKLKTLT